jgi:hypothetical protein
MNEKNIARQRFLQRIGANHEYYSQKRRDANKVCRQKKKIRLNKIKEESSLNMLSLFKVRNP